VNRELVERFLSFHPYARNTHDRYLRVLGLAYGQPVEDWQAVDLIGFVTRPEWGNSQQRLALYAFRKFIRWRWGDDHPALKANIKQVKPKKQRTLSAYQALELLASFDTSCPAGARDLAIAAVALDTGLRCSELCRLELGDVDLCARTLQVIIKGGQWGMGVFSEQTALYVSAWLAFRKPADGVGTLFVSLQHQRLGRPLTREGLQGIVEWWGLRLGMKLSPHDLRRTFATLSTIFGAPSRIVQVAGRWSSIGMVERYTRGLEMTAIAPYLPVAHLVK
jgi:integrase